jgi:hypothetical protein
LLGAMQWAISLCRFDIATAVMTLGRFRVAPRVGHMDRLKRVCGYLRKYPDAAIRFRTGIPNYDDHEIPKHDWMYSVYGETSEEMPSGMPTPKGKPIRTTSFVDANLMHDLTTGRSATGILHFLNQTPIDFGVLRLYCLHLYLSTTRPLLTSCSLFPVLQMSHSTDL